jgi:hypothetical protein
LQINPAAGPGKTGGAGRKAHDRGQQPQFLAVHGIADDALSDRGVCGYGSLGVSGLPGSRFYDHLLAGQPQHLDGNLEKRAFSGGI